MRAWPHLLHLAVALAITGRLWADPAHRTLGRAEGEFRDHLWVAWQVQRRVLDDGAVPLHFPLAGLPGGIDLYPLDPLNQAFLLLLSPLGLLPALAVLATACCWLGGFGAMRLAVAAGAGRGAAAVAGALAMIGPPVLGPLVDGQTEVWAVGWMWLVLAELVADGPWDRTRGLRLGALAAALALTCPTQAHGIALVAAPVAVWRARRAVLWAAIPIAIVAAGIGFAIGTDRHVASRASRSDWPPRTVIRDIEVAPEITPVLAGFPVAIGGYDRTAERAPPTTGPRRHSGWIVAIAVLAAAGRPRARWLVAGALLYAAIAAGSARDHGEATELAGRRVPLPFDLFYRWAPLGHLAWKPQVYAVPAWGLAVAAIATLPPGAAVLTGLAAAAELQLRGPTPLPLPAMDLHSQPLHAVLAEGIGGVVTFPCRARSRNGIDALPADVYLDQLFHRRAIGETFGRKRNPTHQGLLDALAATVGWRVKEAPPLEAAWERAVEAGFSTLVVHARLLEAREQVAIRSALPAPCREIDGVWACGMAP